LAYSLSLIVLPDAAKIDAEPVKVLAEEKGIPYFSHVSSSTGKSTTRCRFAADIMVVVAYGLILPKAVLEMPSGLPERARLFAPTLAWCSTDPTRLWAGDRNWRHHHANGCRAGHGRYAL
jgi:methionyl-tRNA formyltransferase